MKPAASIIFLILLLNFSIFTTRNVQAQYCIDNLYTIGCLYSDYIGDVSLDSINQTSTGCGLNGYSNYTNLTSYLEQGSNYTLFVSTGNYGDYISMWIDFNDDYEFDSTEKLISDLLCYDPNTYYSASFTISPLAPLSEHRMRLRAVQYTTNFDACSNYGFGEVHDYMVSIMPPTDMSYVSSTTTQPSADTVSLGSTDVEIIGVQVVTSGSLSPISLTSLTLNSNGSTDFNGDVTDVKVYFTGTNPSFSTGNLFGSATDLASPVTGSQELSQGTNYFWVAYDISETGNFNDYLDAECTSLTVGGSNYIPTITAPAGNIQLGFCIPDAVYSCYFAYIDGVELNTLSNTFTYCDGSANGYIEYAPTGNLTTSLQQGNSYLISLTGPAFEMVGFGVWLDTNNDGDFEDSGEYLFSSPGSYAGLQTGYLTVPAAVSPGEHRLRVRCKDYDTLSANESCATFNYGETEDYTVTITSAQCFAGFTLYPDSLIPHHYWAINSASGTSPLTYFWNWGDGTSDTSAYPSHTYDTAGYYTIFLTIDDATGCESMFCNTYEIQKLSEMNTIISVDVVDSIPDIATAVQNSNLLQSWSVFPNPASQKIFVNYSLSVPASVNIELFDFLGNKLKQEEKDEQEGEHRSIIDVKKLPNGIYYLQIRAGGQIVSQKIVVIN